MRVFKDLQFVENLGSGIHRILARYDKSIFKISEHFLEICFPFAEDYMLEVTQGNQKGGQIGGQISPMQKDEFGKISARVRNEFGREVAKTFEIISVDPYVTASQIAKQIGKTTRTVEKHISKLKEGAVIERVGPNLGGYWKILIS
jgi:predicted HTH transcriptional regulator